MNPFVQLMNFNGWTEETQKKIMRFTIKISTIFFIILYIIGFFAYMHSVSSERVLGTTNVALYFVGLLLPLLFFFLIIIMQLEDRRYLGLIIAGIVVTLIIFLQTLLPSFNAVLLSIFNYFISYVKIPFFSEESSFLLILVSKMLLASICIIALTIIFNVFLNESYKQKKWNGIFLYLLFYIPCLINDYIQYLFEEFKMTPNVVYVLIILEIIFILLYIYLPKLFQKIVLSTGVTIVKSPKFFMGKNIVSNNKPFLGNSPELKSNVFQMSTDPSQNQVQMRNYSISMWVTVNTPFVSVSNESMIFRYGQDSEENTGCPYIAYTTNDMWKIVLTNGTTPLEQVSFSDFSNNYIDWVKTALTYDPLYGKSEISDQWYQKTRNDYIYIEPSGTIFLTDDETTFLTNYNLPFYEKNDENNKKLDSINNKIAYMYKKRFNLSFNNTQFIPDNYLLGNIIDASHLLKIKDLLGDNIPNNIEEAKRTKETTLKNFIIKKQNILPIQTTIHLPSQRWNNLVFNYKGSQVDLFVNGVLTRTISFDGNNPIYRPTDVVTIGNEKNNIHGAICNVVVYPEVLTINQIIRTFNILQLKNPPLL